MKSIRFLGFIIVMITPLFGFAQRQVSPVPIMEKEIRNGTSLKMRSAELERVKKEANKKSSDQPTAKKIVKFAEVKKDFESIQKLQNSIIKTYTNGKKINYKKIAKYAESMTVKARRLDINMFGEKEVSELNKNSALYRKVDKLNIKELIINLDRSIGRFVTNPIFKDLKTVDTRSSKKAQKELKLIVNLSQILYRKAEDSK